MIPYAMAQPFLTKQIIIHQPFLQCAAVYSKSFRNLIKASSSGIALLRCMDFHFRTDQCRNDAPRVVRKFFSLCLLYGEHSKPCLALLVQRIESPIYHPLRWFRRGISCSGSSYGSNSPVGNRRPLLPTLPAAVCSASSWYRPAECRWHRSGRKAPARSSQWPKDCSFPPSPPAQAHWPDEG